MDGPDYQLLVPLFPLLRAGDPLELVFPLDVAELHRQVQDASVLAQVTALHPVPYHMRHTEVSHDMVSQQRSLAEAKKRGRWGHDRCLRRYFKGGCLGEQLQRLPVGAGALLRLPRSHWRDPRRAATTLATWQRHE